MLTDHWERPSNELNLVSDEAHVWRASLNQNRSTILKMSTFLAPEERGRAEKYFKAIDRDHFIIARGVLRGILSTYLRVPPNEIKFIYNEYGKPAIHDNQNYCALNFNLSHSKDLALYALACGRRVGVDIEYIREEFATLDIAERFFSKDEVKALKAAPEELRTEAFFNCWSRKEAYIKAIGMGVSYPLDGFTVSLAPGAPALLNVSADESEPTRWRMYAIIAAEDYASALIVENPPVNPRQWQWTF